MRTLIAIALLLLASNVSARGGRRKEDPEKLMAVLGAAQDFVEIPPVGPARPPQAAAAVESLGGRRLLKTGRALLGSDGSDVQSQLVVLAKQCPTAATETPYDTIPYTATNETLGELVSDNGICYTGAGNGNVITLGSAGGTAYGASTQDFGATKPSWETYGWSLFYVPMPPQAVTANGGATNLTRIQGINLHVIGNVGQGSSSPSCSLSHLSVGIFDADQSTYAVQTPALLQSKIILTNGATTTNFTWSSNTTTYLYTDIVDIAQTPNGLEVVPGKYYWLRVKLHAAYTSSNRCFVFWGLSSTVHNDVSVKGRWQERGGSSGYSTVCSGASGSPTLAPGSFQTFYNCWNNGVNFDLGANALRRRCSTYRLMVNPALNSSDCTSGGATGGAQFNDFNYALVGFQGEVGAFVGA